jgi:Nuclease-related domain
MVVKELDEFYGNGEQAEAGYKAEKQIAHYLLRKFHNAKDIFAINNLRFPWLDGYTQIDHLIVHRFGLIIVESKSVSSKVKYNTHKEWHRLWNNSWIGMDNPVKQAERQAEAVKTLLRNNGDQLRGKLLGLLQKGFKHMPVDCIVAISDQCNGIERPAKDPYRDIVIKADLVTDRIMEIITTYKKATGILSKSEPPWSIGKAELENVKDFLLSIHEPFQNKKNAVNLSDDRFKPKPAKKEKVRTYNRCPKCKGKITIRKGYSYYWYCESCDKNFPIKHNCTECKQELKVRKENHNYFICCEPCNLEALFYTEV